MIAFWILSNYYGAWKQLRKNSKQFKNLKKKLEKVVKFKKEKKKKNLIEKFWVKKINLVIILKLGKRYNKF